MSNNGTQDNLNLINGMWLDEINEENGNHRIIIIIIIYNKKIKIKIDIT